MRVEEIPEPNSPSSSSRYVTLEEVHIYVLEGTPLSYEVEGQPPVTLKPGDVLFIPPARFTRRERRRPKSGGAGDVSRRKRETAPR
jgi:hypothetical protein